MSAPFQMFLLEEAVPRISRRRRRLSIDYFAGGGGASEGIRMALGKSPDVAINHCPAAIAMHRANHPESDHVCVDVFDLNSRTQIPPGHVDFSWGSPACTHHANARGGKPVNEQLRGQAWVLLDFAEARSPDVGFLENVIEFLTWGPLLNDRPDPSRKGEHFREFVAALESLGYVVEWRVIDAADFGAPTHRRRLFLIYRRDGRPIVWPEPTHGPGRALPWVPVSTCIDWSLPSVSIFGRSRPLAEATMRRIAEGLRRYVIECADPYIVDVEGGRIAATMIERGYGEREGQAPRVRDINRPLGTIVACGVKHGLVTAWLVKNYTGMVGHKLDRPIGTITARDHHALAEVHLSNEDTEGARRCAAFITTYYGNSIGQSLREPLRTIVSKARHGLVEIVLGGEPWAIADIRLRMLDPEELKLAQGFRRDYILTGTKAQKIERIGNSVCPQVACALVGANVEPYAQPRKRSAVAA